jgi:hypothetical protein
MRRTASWLLLSVVCTSPVAGDTIEWEGRSFETVNVKAAIVNLRGEHVLKLERDLQYFAYPGFKFADLRKEAPGLYETYADIGLDEWITMRIHVTGQKAELYLNEARFPSFIVNKMKGTSKAGTIGLYVDVGTEGYFKDFRIISSIPPALGGAR